MTKYFTFVKNNSVTQYGLLPIRDVSGKTYHCQGVIDKLNALHEENTELKNELKYFKRIIFKDNTTGKDIILYEKVMR